ncbi:MAG: hypothetical protein WA364_11860 [Candidatus Nitrosopolaris sp.]
MMWASYFLETACLFYQTEIVSLYGFVPNPPSRFGHFWTLGQKIRKTDKRWIRTWNDYLQRIKYFFRWLYNQKEIEAKGFEPIPTSDWTTPGFCQIKENRTKRISPYLETELWERD